MLFDPPLCITCTHKLTEDPRQGLRCKAFPAGIPEEIIHWDFDHRKPHPDDNGIQYEELLTSPAEWQPGRDLIIPKEWLQHHITEAEARRAVGEDTDSWAELKTRIQQEDRLYWFVSPFESWEHLAGRQGVALIRNNEVIASVVTLMS